MPEACSDWKRLFQRFQRLIVFSFRESREMILVSSYYSARVLRIHLILMQIRIQILDPDPDPNHEYFFMIYKFFDQIKTFFFFDTLIISHFSTVANFIFIWTLFKECCQRFKAIQFESFLKHWWYVLFSEYKI